MKTKQENNKPIAVSFNSHELPTPTPSPTQAKRKLGSNRGKTRLWLEGNILSAHGWHTGDRFDVILIDGVLKYAKNPNGARKVAGKPGRPIIDTNTDKLSTTLNASPGEIVNVIATAQSITVQK